MCFQCANNELFSSKTFENTKQKSCKYTIYFYIYLSFSYLVKFQFKVDFKADLDAEFFIKRLILFEFKERTAVENDPSGTFT